MKNLVINFKKIIYCFCFFSVSHFGLTRVNAQNSSGKEDTAFVNTLLQQSKEHLRNNPAMSISLAVQANELAGKINFLSGKAYALKNIGLGYYYQGKYIEALSYWNESLEFFKQMRDDIGVANLLNNIAAIYINNGDDTNALEYSLQSLKLSEQSGDKLRILSALNTVGSIYFGKEITMDKALGYFLKAIPLSEKLGNSEASAIILGNIGEIYYQMGNDANALIYFNKSIGVPLDSGSKSFAYNGMGKLYLRKGDFEQALKYHQKALAIAEVLNSKLDIVHSLEGIANVYIKENKQPSALSYFQKAVTISKELGAIPELKDIYEEMALAYSGVADYHNAFKYQSLYSSIKGTLYSIDKDKKFGSLQFEFDLQKKQSEINLLAKEKSLRQAQLKKQKYLRNGLLIGLVLVLILAFVQWRHSKQKQKINTLLIQQKKETEQQKEKVEKTLEELKITQKQLIQSEKMASLGELTAGIAHEIQNPLNFVNNFSDVNTELIDELEQEVNKGNLNEVKAIAKDIKENEQKINHHGKRADAIVKGMLQHSRSRSGVKEPTNINALADEYLRLAYHGLRAKDKSFNATMKTDFDESIGNINIIPQDIGRVILNLITNAFYAAPLPPEGGFKNPQIKHEPTVWVSTKKEGNKVLISVRDNGPGIPQKILDKIFQPFFTTKPTGQGTGLGLSLSYDIVKAHGGEIKVKTKEKEGTEFIILIPLA